MLKATQVDYQIKCQRFVKGSRAIAADVMNIKDFLRQKRLLSRAGVGDTTLVILSSILNRNSFNDRN